MSEVATTSILPGRGGVMGRLSDLFWRRPNLLLALMLIPPLLWLGIIYVGSLVALLLQSFFSIDEFSGMINYELTFATYGQLLNPANFDIILRTVLMAAIVTLASAVLAFPIAYYAARYATGMWSFLARSTSYGRYTSSLYGYTQESAQTYPSKTIADAEVGYRFRIFGVALGARNLFDTYPGFMKPDNSFFIFPYPSASPFGFNGRYIYTRVDVGFSRQ